MRRGIFTYSISAIFRRTIRVCCMRFYRGTTNAALQIFQLLLRSRFVLGYVL